MSEDLLEKWGISKVIPPEKVAAERESLDPKAARRLIHCGRGSAKQRLKQGLAPRVPARQQSRPRA